MAMETMQIRMSEGLVKNIDKIVKTGIYSNRADFIRDAVRRFIWSNEIGSVSVKGDAEKTIKDIRKLREKLDEEEIDLKEINGL